MLDRALLRLVCCAVLCSAVQLQRADLRIPRSLPLLVGTVARCRLPVLALVVAPRLLPLRPRCRPALFVPPQTAAPAAAAGRRRRRRVERRRRGGRGRGRRRWRVSVEASGAASGLRVRVRARVGRGRSGRGDGGHISGGGQRQLRCDATEHTLHSYTNGREEKGREGRGQGWMHQRGTKSE